MTQNTSRNIVLICLDTVRKDYFDKYAPRLQELADVSFEQCRAASAWSTPSHASIMTGKLPHEHGIHTHNRNFTELSRADTFLSALPEYAALGASANVYASSTFGFDRMFDQYSDVAPHRRFPEGIDMEKFIQDREEKGARRYLEFFREIVDHDHLLASLANGVLFKANDFFRKAPLPKLLDDGATIVSKEGLSLIQSTQEPFFLFTNFMDAHGPVHHVWGYNHDLHSAPNTWTSFKFDDWEINTEGVSPKHEKDLQYHRELYGAAIDYLDRQVISFIDRIQEVANSPTTFVITADHGENLGLPADNELFGHTSSLTESLLHVPCYLINPPEGYKNKETDYVSHLKLGQLLTGLANNETPDVFNKQIVAELVGIGVGGAPRDPEEHRFWDRMLRCAYDSETKYVWDSLGNTSEYELDHNRPCWQKLIAENVEVPPWTEDFFNSDIQTYKRRARDEEKTTEIDASVQSRLENLGYR